ncbi:hypothetical protein WN51_05664 [Melipona quadrifasciata]|uniref:Uncharacterized protein n=1 Tax=Melipona quadrifasciata TaxID=166423 RepID=A0A0N0U3Z7_9HYME|nr:hypothetical protein WN51_05664 [Melipona quadrifasciata]
MRVSSGGMRELDEFPARPKFRSQSDRAAERQSARAPERKQSDQLGNDEIRVDTCVTRMTRNHMQVKTLRMLEELAIAEEEGLNNDGDSLDNIQWNEFANKQQSFTFTGKSGLLMELPSNISPGEVLSLFLDEKLARRRASYFSLSSSLQLALISSYHVGVTNLEKYEWLRRMRGRTNWKESEWESEGLRFVSESLPRLIIISGADGSYSLLQTLVVITTR